MAVYMYKVILQYFSSQRLTGYLHIAEYAQLSQQIQLHTYTTVYHYEVCL